MENFIASTLYIGKLCKDLVRWRFLWQRRGVGGQKKPITCQSSLWTDPYEAKCMEIQNIETGMNLSVTHYGAVQGSKPARSRPDVGTFWHFRWRKNFWSILPTCSTIKYCYRLFVIRPIHSFFQLNRNELPDWHWIVRILDVKLFQE